MGTHSERLHLLLVAFAIFFACVHGPVRRHAVSEGGGFPEAISVDAAPHGGNADTDAGHESNDSPVVLEPAFGLGAAADAWTRVAERRESPRGRVIGFGDTPPPRAI